MRSLPETTRAFSCALALSLATHPGFARAQSGTQVWSQAVAGPVWTPLAHHGGHLYFGSDDSTFYAFALDRKAVSWRFRTLGIIRSGAVAADGLVLFASDDGFLYALAEESGAEVWRTRIAGPGVGRRLPSPDPPFEYDYAHSTPTVRDGVVYVGSAAGALHALDLETGKERWRYTTDGKVRSTPAVAAGTVYFGSWDGHVYAVDAMDGDLAWRFDSGGVIQGAPAVGAGMVFVGSRSATVFALHARSGELVWEHVHEDGSWVESSPVYADGVLYVGSSDGRALFALDAKSGEARWRFETGGWSWSTPRVTDGTVYIGSLSASPYPVELRPGFFAVDRDRGAELWKFRPASVEGFVSGGVFSTPAVIDGLVYVAGLDGRLYAFRK
jgi:outer membrane protein assembly factor BamB